MLRSQRTGTTWNIGSLSAGQAPNQGERVILGRGEGGGLHWKQGYLPRMECRAQLSVRKRLRGPPRAGLLRPWALFCKNMNMETTL